MGKEAEPLQPIGKTKAALMMSKRQPVPFAFAINKDDDEGVLYLLLKGRAKGALNRMKKEAKKAGMTLDMSKCRFGMAEVDKNEDARLVTFTCNKAISNSIRPKLLPIIKKAGLGKCEFVVDEKLEDEPEDEGEDEDEGAAPGATAAPAQDQAAAAPVAGQPNAAPAEPNAKQPNPDPNAKQANPDPALAKRLTDLVKRMVAIMGSKPAGADAMKTAAMAAQTAMKSGDAQEATASADTLERLLDAADQAGAGQKGGPKNGPGSPVFDKARGAWVSTRKRVEDELEKLHKELQATYQGHGVVADLEKVFRSKVEPMMSKLDNSLSDKLDEVSKASDPAQHSQLVEEARKIISDFEGYLSSEPLIAKLDSNPFVPLSIQKTLAASLAALSKAVA